MNQQDIKGKATALVADRIDILESLAATGNNMERALAETFLEIGVGQ